MSKPEPCIVGGTRHAWSKRALDIPADGRLAGELVSERYCHHCGKVERSKYKGKSHK